MNHFPAALTLACLATFGAASGAHAQAQGLRPSASGGGITDIMRAGPRPVAPGAGAGSAPAAPTGQRPAEFIVALVNSEPITNTEVQSRVTRIARENAEAQRIPRPELTRLVLERLIAERAQLQLAKESNLKVDDVAVEQAEQLVARQNQVSLEELRRRVIAEGISPEEFRSDLRNQLLLTRLREREVNARVKISDVEVDQYIQEQRGQPGVVADGNVTQTQARHILLRNDPQRSTAQAVAQLAEFKRRLDAGTADFAGLARDNSQDGSAKDGGDLGWARPGQFVPEFEEAINRLAPGQVSEPVVTRFGVHLIQVVGRRDVKLSQAEQREAARIVLREKRMDDAFDTWAQEVRARAYVEFRETPQ